MNSDPMVGRPIEEATAAFQRVMALDPRNREVKVYLMDLAANANRTGQLDTLYSMYFSPNSAGEQPGIRATYTALHRRRIATAGTRRDLATPIDEPGLARVALQRISTDVRDRSAARSYATVLVAGPGTAGDGLLTLATLDCSTRISQRSIARSPRWRPLSWSVRTRCAPFELLCSLVAPVVCHGAATCRHSN